MRIDLYENEFVLSTTLDILGGKETNQKKIVFRSMYVYFCKTGNSMKCSCKKKENKKESVHVDSFLKKRPEEVRPQLNAAGPAVLPLH